MYIDILLTWSAGYGIICDVYSRETYTVYIVLLHGNVAKLNYCCIN